MPARVRTTDDPDVRRTPPTRQVLVGALLLVVTVLALVQCAGDGTERSPEAFCSQLEASADLDERLTGSPAALESAAAELAALEQRAPADIEPTVARLRSAIEAMASGARADGVEGALQAVQDEREDIDAASDRLAVYARETCGIELTEVS